MRLPIVFSSSYLLHIPNPRTFTGISCTFVFTVCRRFKSGGTPRLLYKLNSITNRVVIAVGMLDYLAVFVPGFNLLGFSPDTEIAISTNRCQSTNMRTLRLTFGHYSFDAVTD